MPKKIFIVLMMFFCVFFSTVKVDAKVLDTGDNIEYRLDKKECKLFDPDGNFVDFLQDLFDIMKYAGPILCLVLSTMDFIKAAASQDKEALKKAAQTSLKRLGLALVLFFIPTLINFLFPLLGWNGTCGIH